MLQNLSSGCHLLMGSVSEKLEINVMTKCLVVDDDLDMLQVLADFVRTLGYEPLKARDGDEAWEVFKREQPGFVISDIHMPNRNGLLLMSDIKNQNPNIPVILITGYFQYRKVFRDRKPDAYLEKPFALDDLRQAIKKVMSLTPTVH
jgi:DNA-binding NtrC family response regulator